MITGQVSLAGMPPLIIAQVLYGLWVAGVPYGRVYREAGGKALPRMEGCHRLQEDEVFLASAQPRSTRPIASR